MTEKKIVIVTGLSGSGKSTVAHTLEDVGYFCVDNLPIDLLPKLFELTHSRGSELTHLALVIDTRQSGLSQRYSDILSSLETKNAVLEVLFLDSRDEVLVRRYSETRRQHPMAATGNVLDGISKERQELEEIKGKANWVIDTSDLTVHQLSEEVKKIFQGPRTEFFKIIVNSFGFGRGLPLESDLVLDVRFLPNPHFVEELKSKDGRDREVVAWLRSHSTTEKFLERLEELLVFLLPLYIKEGKQYLTISVGCTGGRHRSVFVADYIAKVLILRGYASVEVRHREIAASK